ncbi:MAG: DUF5615 family PIN-like protein [Candidatus Diapherotrites archaeon]|nr:DUF5615 family PIN-like protein [Candidatus Diapherotrites archaeon]
MLFLADENVSMRLVKALRTAGHTVKDIKEEKLFGISDLRILELAVAEKRIILTHDKDFLNLSRQKLVKHSGIIVLRFSNQKSANVTAKFLSILELHSSEKFKNSLVIISDMHMEIIRTELE